MTTKTYVSDQIAINAKFHGSDEGFHMHPEWMMDAGSQVSITTDGRSVTEIVVEPQGWVFRYKDPKGANILGGSHTTDDWFTFHIKHFYLVNPDGSLNYQYPLSSKPGMEYAKTVTVLTPKDIPCFWEDTLILSEDNVYVRVSDIKVGDQLWSVEGPRTVLWVGGYHGPATSKNLPYHYNGNKLSPEHRVAVTVREGRDTSFDGLIAVKHHPAAVRLTHYNSVHYYHILLDKHALLNCSGQLCESLWPGKQVLKMNMPGLSAALRDKIDIEKYVTEPALPFLNKHFKLKV